MDVVRRVQYLSIDYIKITLHHSIMRSLTVLADPTRRHIVEMLVDGPLCAGDIADRFDMTAPAVSQHLKALREAKLVSVRQDAQRRIYELNPTGVRELSDWVDRLRGFWAPKLDALERAIKKDRSKNRRKRSTR